MSEILRSSALLLVLLNPFLVIVYLVDVMEKLTTRSFAGVLARAGAIASVVFCGFVLLGDAIFSDMVQADFASFQIFGGLVFLLIGLQFVFRGPKAIEILRGESQHLTGAIAMPVLIGPATISASVLIGKRHSAALACAIAIAAVATFVVVTVALKQLHDFVRPRNERLVERYIEIAGRVTALIVGTVAVDMILRGLGTWLNKL